MQNFNLPKALETLKINHFLGLEVEDRYYILLEANHEETVANYKEYQQSFELILDSSNRLESYVAELNPLAFDIIDFSEKPIVLISIGGKNLAPSAIMPDTSIQIRVVREGELQQFIRKFRMPLLLCAISDEDASTLEESNTYSCAMQDAFLESSLIRLDPNGRVEILRS
jgi:L-threonylcarbamoyladenylate synthase